VTLGVAQLGGNSTTGVGYNANSRERPEIPVPCAADRPGGGDGQFDTRRTSAFTRAAAHVRGYKFLSIGPQFPMTDRRRHRAAAWLGVEFRQRFLRTGWRRRSLNIGAPLEHGRRRGRATPACASGYPWITFCESTAQW
jgi:hypothetical protein